MSPVVLRWLNDGRSEWLAADGRVQAGLPPADPEQSLLVLVPGEDVLLLDLPRLAGSAAQLDQAVPYAVEDQLAAPVETQHVAWAPGRHPQRLQVAIASRERMLAWLTPLREAGLEPDRLLPDTLALPDAPGASLLLESGRGLLRWDGSRALAMEAATLAAVLDLPALAPTVWHANAEAPSSAAAQAVPAVLPWLAQGIAANGLNLLQGSFAPRRRSGQLQRDWRWAAGLAAAVLVLVFAAALVDYAKLAARVEAQETEMVELYRRAVPGATSVLRPAEQLQSVLAGQGMAQGDAALDLLRRAAPAVMADPGLRLEGLDYREGRMELAVQAADVAGLDALRQRLVAGGVAAEIIASTPGTQGVQGRLRLGARP